MGKKTSCGWLWAASLPSTSTRSIIHKKQANFSTSLVSYILGVSFLSCSICDSIHHIQHPISYIPYCVYFKSSSVWLVIGTLKVLPDVAVASCRLCCVTPSVLQKCDVWENFLFVGMCVCATVQPPRLGVPLVSTLNLSISPKCEEERPWLAMVKRSRVVLMKKRESLSRHNWEQKSSKSVTFLYVSAVCLRRARP